MKGSAFMKWWAKLSPSSRQVLSLAALFSVIVGTTALLFKEPPPTTPVVDPKKEVKETNLTLPVKPDTSQEAIAASVYAVKSDAEKQKAAIEAQAAKQKELEDARAKEAEEAKKKESANNAEVVQLIAKLSAEVEELKAGKTAQVIAKAGSGSPALGDTLPVPGEASSGPSFSFSPEEAPKRKYGAIKVSGGHDKSKEEASAVVTEEKRTPYLSAGSMFEGILITGMDAPTSSVTQKNPVPSVVRIKTDATMPNLYTLGVRECFVLISGFGVMATERAQLRSESISCIKEDGSVLESKLDGYVVGEDGKAGMRGRLVSKQGAMIAKSLAAGFLSGFSSSVTPSAVSQLNTMPGATQQFQSPNLGKAAETGVYKGVAESSKMISQFYLEMAKDMFPVVEIDAGRRITIVVIKGLEF